MKEFEKFVDALGLRHFRGAEFTPYWSRTRGRVKNAAPPAAVWPNIVPTLLIADELRERCGKALTVLSSYRSPAYNRAVGGEPNSFHMRFMALDLTCGGLDAERLHKIAAGIRGTHVFRVGNETFKWNGGLGLYVQSNFIHIDCRAGKADWKGN